MANDDYEIAVGAAKNLVASSRTNREQMFFRMNG